jgi:hypothetical protein
MEKFIITEEEKKSILRLHEQEKTGFNLFTYKDIISNMVNSMGDILENTPVNKICSNVDGYLKPIYGQIDDLLVKISADTKMPEGDAIKYVHDNWEQQKTGGMGLLLKMIGPNVTVPKEMVDKLYEYIRTKPNGGLLNVIISDIFGKAKIKQMPIC